MRSLCLLERISFDVAKMGDCTYLEHSVEKIKIIEVVFPCTLVNDPLS
jgi:hypothetical protein